MLPFRLASSFIALLLLCAPVHAADTPASVRLYAMDCGRIEFKDMGLFADGDEYAGQPGKLVASCFLIVHPKGTLLWDTGLGDAMAAKPDGVINAALGIHTSVPVTLQSQLRQLKIEPENIDFVGLSHLHFDHAGNLQAFPKATWVLNPAELAWATAAPTPFGVDPSTFSDYRNAKLRENALDDDLFGDGSVRILRAPGHTPGHRVLLLKLRNAGSVLLSGDLYHSRANYEQSRVPSFNDSRADTMASFDRVKRLLETHRGRIVVQHDPKDFDGLPKFPAYLD